MTTIGAQWSESGLDLLDKFKREIQKNGGCQRLADLIESEWIKSGHKRRDSYIKITDKYHYSQLEVDFIKEHYGHVRIGEMAKLMNRDSLSLTYKVRYMKEKGLLCRPR